MTEKFTAGWDLGGAHLKLVILDENGNTMVVRQEICPLWRGLDQLTRAVQRVLPLIPENSRHGITMSGELVDLFADRSEGVMQLVLAMRELLGDRMEIFAGQHGFLSSRQVTPELAEQIASANWLASASLAAERIGQGVFVDVGSTTTDLVILHDHRVVASGMTDYERLCSDELLYTGVARTPLMAVAPRVTFEGQSAGVMAEHFATTADVYRLTGEISDSHDQTESADGRSKSPHDCARRLARMIGRDVNSAEHTAWCQLAREFRLQQKNRISNAIAMHLARSPLTSGQPVLIGAGVGQFLLREICQDLGLAFRSFDLLLGESAGSVDTLTAGDCAPAASVARLLQFSA